MKLRMQESAILRSVTKGLIPLVLLFALYVQFHGDFGPGGGFQAGVIFAAGLILYALIFGPVALQRVVPERVVELGIVCGLLIYGGTGVACLFGGYNFLDYTALDTHHPAHGQHLGILLVELGVGVTVTAVMVTIYYCFSMYSFDAAPEESE
jgi:multicomponent Na+:H+ antiporter subunit B